MTDMPIGPEPSMMSNNEPDIGTPDIDSRAQEATPIGYCYGQELQSSPRSWITVSRHKEGPYDTPLYVRPLRSPAEVGPAQCALRCARCGSSGDAYILCSGCGMPASPPYPVESALIECASRCRYDGDLWHDQGNISRRDASGGLRTWQPRH